MNWLVPFADHRDGWIPCAVIVSESDEKPPLGASEAIRRAAKKADSLCPLEGYKSVQAIQVIA